MQVSVTIQSILIFKVAYIYIYNVSVLDLFVPCVNEFVPLVLGQS